MRQSDAIELKFVLRGPDGSLRTADECEPGSSIVGMATSEEGARELAESLAGEEAVDGAAGAREGGGRRGA